MRIEPTEFTKWLANQISAFSAETVADSSGVSIATIYRLRKGGSPRLDTLEKLGAKLEVPKA